MRFLDLKYRFLKWEFIKKGKNSAKIIGHIKELPKKI